MGPVRLAIAPALPRYLPGTILPVLVLQGEIHGSFPPRPLTPNPSPPRGEGNQNPSPPRGEGNQSYSKYALNARIANRSRSKMLDPTANLATSRAPAVLEYPATSMTPDDIMRR